MIGIEAVVAAAIGLMVGAGVYLVLRARTFSVVLGLTLLSHGVNVFIFSMGRLAEGLAPIIEDDAVAYPDPLPQALVLTAIVISFSLFAFLLVLAYRAYKTLGTVDTDEMRDAEPLPAPAQLRGRDV